MFLLFIYHLFGSPSSSIGHIYIRDATQSRQTTTKTTTTATTTVVVMVVVLVVKGGGGNGSGLLVLLFVAWKFYFVYFVRFANAALFNYCTNTCSNVSLFRHYSCRHNYLAISTSHAYFWLFNFIFNLPSAAQAFSVLNSVFCWYFLVFCQASMNSFCFAKQSHSLATLKQLHQHSYCILKILNTPTSVGVIQYNTIWNRVTLRVLWPWLVNIKLD